MWTLIRFFATPGIPGAEVMLTSWIGLILQCNIRQNIFGHRVIGVWNALPSQVVDAENVAVLIVHCNNHILNMRHSREGSILTE